MKKVFWRIIFSMLAGVIITSCVESFSPSISGEDSVDLLVVDGLITDQPGPYEVYLSRTVPLDAAFYENPEQSAIVTLYDDAGNEEVLVEEEDGVYRTSADGIQGEIGRSYTLHIVTADGWEYESSAVKIEPVAPVGNLYFEEFEKPNYDFSGREDMWMGIYLDVQGNENDSRYYRWTYEETWEYDMTLMSLAPGFGMFSVEVDITDEGDIPVERKNCWQSGRSQTTLVKATDAQLENQVKRFNVANLPPGEHKLTKKYSIEVSQYSLNKELYDFFERIKKVNEGGGSLYDQIPSAIYGNVYSCDDHERVLGCFQASAVSTKRMFIDKSDHHIKTTIPFSGCRYSIAMGDSVDVLEALDDLRREFGNIYMLGERYKSSRYIVFVVLEEDCSDCRLTGSGERPPFWE